MDRGIDTILAHWWQELKKVSLADVSVGDWHRREGRLVSVEGCFYAVLGLAVDWVPCGAGVAHDALIGGVRVMHRCTRLGSKRSWGQRVGLQRGCSSDRTPIDIESDADLYTILIPKEGGDGLERLLLFPSVKLAEVVGSSGRDDMRVYPSTSVPRGKARAKQHLHMQYEIDLSKPLLEGEQLGKLKRIFFEAGLQCTHLNVDENFREQLI